MRRLDYIARYYKREPIRRDFLLGRLSQTQKAVLNMFSGDRVARYPDQSCNSSACHLKVSNLFSGLFGQPEDAQRVRDRFSCRNASASRSLCSREHVTDWVGSNPIWRLNAKAAHRVNVRILTMNYFSAKAAPRKKANKVSFPSLEQALLNNTQQNYLRALALKQSSSVKKLLYDAEASFPDWREYLRSATSVKCAL